MIVRPASRMFSAISLGVFCRSAPSTSAIMRSMNVSPGFEVIFTLIRSDSTRVPPVTAERSPPDSRMTGADSPVIADSSTDATPSITSPSPGMISPAEPRRYLPRAAWRRQLFRSCRPQAADWPWFPTSRLRSVSAWALPRPSAIASAKFANSTVNQSHSVSGDQSRSPAMASNVFEQQHRCDHAAHLDHEHYRILHHGARIQLAHRIDQRRRTIFRVPQGFRLACCCHVSS